MRAVAFNDMSTIVGKRGKLVCAEKLARDSLARWGCRRLSCGSACRKARPTTPQGGQAASRGPWPEPNRPHGPDRSSGPGFRTRPVQNSALLRATTNRPQPFDAWARSGRTSRHSEERETSPWWHGSRPYALGPDGDAPGGGERPAPTLRARARAREGDGNMTERPLGSIPLNHDSRPEHRGRPARVRILPARALGTVRILWGPRGRWQVGH